MADEAFEFTITAKATSDGIQIGTSGTGQPRSNNEFQEMLIHVAARPLTTMYESWLLGTNRENTADARAVFFIDHQPAIMRAFMAMADSQQFMKSLEARREAIKKAQEGNPKAE